MYAEVLIEYSAKSIDKTFTYLIPPNLQGIIQVGMKVLVPFGPNTINGFVTKIVTEYQETYELKEIVSISDYNLILNKEMMELGEYIKETTLCTKIAAYQTMLPSSLKVKDQKHDYNKYITYIELNKDEEEIVEYINNHKRSKKQIEILETLLVDHQVLKSNISGSSLNTLIELELVKEVKEQIYRIDYGKVFDETKIKLTEEQQNALDNVVLE